jgi:thiamine-phosphate pyrophosphorylase
MKGFEEEVVHETSLEVRNITLKYDATFIINDYYALVQHCDADGVHLGKSDEKPNQVRQFLGEEYIIGGTANTLEDIGNLVDAGIDYIGLGPYRETMTKSNLSPILGLEGYRKVIRILKETSVKTPIIAIGGIKEEDIKELMKTGISGIALSGYLTEGDVKTKYNNIIKQLKAKS